MFRIGEFSKLTKVSVRMLRYYDETGLLKPSKINDKTGYRMYSVEQTKILNKIIFLRDIGFNVEEIMYVLKHWDKDNLKNQMEEKAKSCKNAIKAEEEKLEKIRIAINEINSEYKEINYNVIVKTIPSYNVISLRKIIPNYFCEGELWNELFKFIEDEKLKISISSLNFAIYHDKEYKEENVDVEVCVVTEENRIAKSDIKYRKTKEFNKVASSMVYGPFENIAGAYKAFVKWLEENGQYRINGISMQICHKGPWNESNPKNYLTEIQIPLEDKNKK